MIKTMNILLLVLFIMKHSVATEDMADITWELEQILQDLQKQVDTIPHSKQVRFPTEKDLPRSTTPDTQAIKSRHKSEDEFFNNVWDGNAGWLTRNLGSAGSTDRQRNQVDLNRDFKKPEKFVTGIKSDKKVRMTLLNAAVYKLKIVEQFLDPDKHIWFMLETIRVLLTSKEKGTDEHLIDVNEVGRKKGRRDILYGDTALHLAVKLEFQDQEVRRRLVELLLAREDIDLTIRDSEYGNTAFFYAYHKSLKYFEYTDIVAMIFDRMDVQALNAPVNEDEDTILHLFVKHGDQDYAKKILSKVPPLIDRQNEEGETALHIAALTSPAMAEMLMSPPYHANPNIPTNDGQTAEAILHQMFTIVDDPDSDSDVEFVTPCHHLAMDEIKSKMEKTLEDARDGLAGYKGALGKQLAEIQKSYQLIGASVSEDPQHCRMELTCGVIYSQQAVHRARDAFQFASTTFHNVRSIEETVERISREVHDAVRSRQDTRQHKTHQDGEDISDTFSKHIAKGIEDGYFSAEEGRHILSVITGPMEDKHNPNTIVAASLIFVDTAMSIAKRYAQLIEQNIESIRRSLEEIELRFNVNAECGQQLCQDRPDLFLLHEQHEEDARALVSLAEKLTAIITFDKI